jgi:hypothetical protein
VAADGRSARLSGTAATWWTTLVRTGSIAAADAEFGVSSDADADHHRFAEEAVRRGLLLGQER